MYIHLRPLQIERYVTEKEEDHACDVIDSENKPCENMPAGRVWPTDKHVIDVWNMKKGPHYYKLSGERMCYLHWEMFGRDIPDDYLVGKNIKQGALN
jgi:hypothetical protein